MISKPFSTLLPITFNVDEAVEYYNTLQNDFKHLKWTMPSYGHSGSSDYQTPTIKGWAILSPKDDNEPHCMLYDSSIQGRGHGFETLCAFGFAKRVLDFFPKAFRMYVTVNSPGLVVKPHTDTFDMPEKVYKIIMPIQTHPDATWVINNETIHMEAGKVYVINPLNEHGTVNNSNIDRVHIMFEVFQEDGEEVFSLHGSI